ncbi:MAG: hypothetical protein JWM80_354 [Cyanobacteria bacterium RYN_339]|nr:hypothetical protein [Cyanobacteria bacterium RYN_339]
MRLATLALLAALGATACSHAAPISAARVPAALQAANSAYAKVLAPKEVPADVVTRALGPAQQAADEASRRRDIDFFKLPSNPVGIQVGNAHVLSFLGTALHDADLNIELRALVAGPKVGVVMNYSGPTTLGRQGFAPVVKTETDTTFELLTGLPGNGVDDDYADYLGHLQDYLAQRYNGQPFTFDDTPLVFAVHQGDAVTGFVLMDQGNRLVLGDRKYADVQSVACYTAEAKLAASYVVVGFNRKAAGPGAAPKWVTERDARFGLIARCGEI